MNEERGLTLDARFEIRKSDGKPSVLHGYAATFNKLSHDLGGFREIIRPGAFEETLASNPDVSCRIQHEGGLTTVGRTTNGTLSLGVDDIGLWYDATVPDTQAGRDIIELVSKGYINKSSFAFTLREAGELWNYEAAPWIRELLSLDLWDVAPVDGPAYESTSIGVREQRAIVFERATEQRNKPHRQTLREIREEIEKEKRDCVQFRINQNLKH